MIDTIELKLHNVSTNYPVTRTRLQATSEKGHTTFMVDKDTGECLENTQIRAIMHHDSSNILPLAQRSDLRLGSHHYTLSYKFDYRQDIVHFNFSIPKYIHGTNIIQFIRYADQSAEGVYRYLVSFIQAFFNKLCFEPVNLPDVEITRVDFCYNQFFHYKYDALRYLDEQKQLVSKFARNTKNEAIRYTSSLFYSTKRYSFKIYHKGTEFERHDRKELAKNNVTKHSVDFLQNVADRINRYEVTFRKSMFDYVFNQRKLYEAYIKWYRKAFPGFRVLSPDMQRRVEDFTKQSKRYVLGAISDVDAIDFKTAVFDLPLFTELYNFFWDYVQKYQLECKMSVYDVMKKAETLNADRDKLKDESLRRKASINTPMVVTLALLAQYYSLDDLKKTGLMPKSTFYRYQKQLSRLGYSSKSRIADMPPPSLDYLEYLSIFKDYHLK